MTSSQSRHTVKIKCWRLILRNRDVSDYRKKNRYETFAYWFIWIHFSCVALKVAQPQQITGLLVKLSSLRTPT